MESEQLNTTHYLANALARSFVDSVFPVPAGPEGAFYNIIYHINKIMYSSKV